MQDGPQGFDDHLFLPNQLVDDKTNTRGTDGHDHHVPLLRQGRILHSVHHPPLEVEQRQGLVTHDNRLLTIDDVRFGQVQVEDFVDINQWQSECLPFEYNHQRRHDRQGQRYLYSDTCPLTDDRVDAEPIHATNFPLPDYIF